MTVTRVDISDISRSYQSAAEAVAFAIASLKSALSVPRYHIGGASLAYLQMRRDLPYVIHETSIPETSILVNRNYKPLGNNQPTGGTMVKYEDFTNLHVCLTPTQIASVVSPGYSRGLFGDGDPPWRGRKQAQNYLERLQRLHRHLSRR